MVSVTVLACYQSKFGVRRIWYARPRSTVFLHVTALFVRLKVSLGVPNRKQRLRSGCSVEISWYPVD